MSQKSTQDSNTAPTNEKYAEKLTAKPAESQTDQDRRSFMTGAIATLGGVITAAVAAPLAGFTVLPAIQKKEPDWSLAGSLEELETNIPHESRFFQTVQSGYFEEKVERTIWLVKKPSGEVVAYSPSCPHLGCGCRWATEEKMFKCPCHNSHFDLEGKVLAGPSPRGLDRFETKVEEDDIFVKFRNYQIGIAEKVEA